MEIKKIIKSLIKSEPWVVRKCLFPYPEGYATYNVKTRTILDTGLTKEQAIETCRELNNNQ